MIKDNGKIVWNEAGIDPSSSDMAFVECKRSDPFIKIDELIFLNGDITSLSFFFNSTLVVMF